MSISINDNIEKNESISDCKCSSKCYRICDGRCGCKFCENEWEEYYCCSFHKFYEGLNNVSK